MAAQGKKIMPEAGAGARLQAAASAYYGASMEAGRLVVLAKPLYPGAGRCTPFAVVRFEDLPEELRRQIAAGASGLGHGAAALPREPNAALPPVAAPESLPREGGTRHHAVLPVDVVPKQGEGLRRQLPRLVSGTDDDERTAKFAGDGSSVTFKDYSDSEQLRRILRLIEKDGKVVVGDMVGSQFQEEKEKAFLGAFHDNGLPTHEGAAPVVVAFVLGDGATNMAGPRALDSRPDGLTFPREDAVPFVQKLVGDGRAAEQGVYYHHDVLLPSENVVPVPAADALRAPCPASPYYAVQVMVDAAAGGKAGDPIAVGVKAGGADAGGLEHGSLSAVLGIVVASSAATALAAGSGGPAAAFGLFAVLVGGLSLAMASVRAR